MNKGTEISSGKIGDRMLQLMATNHEAIVFFSYLIGFVWFVLSMRPKHYLNRYFLVFTKSEWSFILLCQRYGFFAWSHMAIFFLCIPGHMVNKILNNP